MPRSPLLPPLRLESTFKRTLAYWLPFGFTIYAAAILWGAETDRSFAERWLSWTRPIVDVAASFNPVMVLYSNRLEQQGAPTDAFEHAAVVGLTGALLGLAFLILATRRPLQKAIEDARRANVRIPWVIPILMLWVASLLLCLVIVFPLALPDLLTIERDGGLVTVYVLTVVVFSALPNQISIVVHQAIIWITAGRHLGFGQNQADEAGLGK